MKSSEKNKKSDPAETADLQSGLSPQDEAANLLFQLETWFAFTLNGEVKGRQTGSYPTYNSYSYVEIPEWAMRQKLAAIQSVRASLSRVGTAPQQSVEAEEHAFHRGVDAAKEAIRTEDTSEHGDYFKAVFINAIARKCGFDRAAVGDRGTEVREATTPNIIESIRLLEDAGFGDVPNSLPEMVRKAIAAAGSSGSAEWVRVEDDLPIAREEVLFVAEFGGEPMICFGYKAYPGDDQKWYDSANTDRDGDPNEVYGVTHWRKLPPLPAPPADSQEPDQDQGEWGKELAT